MRHVLRRISMDEEIMSAVSQEMLHDINRAFYKAEVVLFLDV
jgi:hypothetical protein